MAGQGPPYVGSAGCGSTSVTDNPPSARLESCTRPPCASAISRASARPRPEPLRYVE
jgi:hypothetical protein